MRVTINLAKGSKPRELVEVLRATEAIKPGRPPTLHPLDLLTAVVNRAVTLALRQLERIVHQYVCSYVTHQRGARLNQTRLKLQQELLIWLRIPPGRGAVKI
jgi:hypothetical protein